MALLKFNDKGIYCEQAGVYIDPWGQVDHAIITHAHADHARWGSRHYLAHHFSLPVMRWRLGADINVQGIGYNEEIVLNGVKISLHPAGHIIGSAQVRLEYKGEIWVVSGDYKLQNDHLATPFEPVRCQHFITESTFGLPVYRFPAVEEVQGEINDWCAKNTAAGKTSVIIGYALGKAQHILYGLDKSIAPIYAHGAVVNMNRALEQSGFDFSYAKPLDYSLSKKELQGCIVVAPPSAVGTPWLRRFDPYSIGICSGWMQLRGARRRRGVDRGFVMSDHCDWQQLNTAVKLTGAENVYVTHGYKSIYAKWLRDEMHLNATEVDTLYEGESIEGDKEEAATESAEAGIAPEASSNEQGISSPENGDV